MAVPKRIISQHDGKSGSHHPANKVAAFHFTLSVLQDQKVMTDKPTDFIVDDDSTQRERTEETLRKSEEPHRRLVEVTALRRLYRGLLWRG